ncbi:MAG TPA: M20/M25/M40 family metallo-hydrolase [Actinomycetota bacterium]|nr:M20/M25/M40 family metallo-hydrolase [Actinomycetota bacterium]
MSRPKGAARVAAAAVALCLGVVAPASTSAQVSIQTSWSLRRGVKTRNVVDHLRKLQQIANRNDGTRAAGSPGYEASARYVERKLDRYGWRVSTQSFEFLAFEEVTPTVMEQVAPEEVAYENEIDFSIMSYSGSGDVTAPVTPVDVNVEDPSEITSGCEDEDFASFPAGNIALIQRGTCTFQEKAVNAEEAGAAAIIIFNQGNTEERSLLLEGDLGDDTTTTIPAVGTTFALGEELVATQGLRIHLVAETATELLTTRNVFGEWRGDARPGADVVMAGAHLDSVPEGPGIQDNGTGVAALLEIARQIPRYAPKFPNRVRLGFWGAEEAGLIGSTEYIAALTEEEGAEIAGYLNFDMIGSPNYARMIYDGNGSSAPDVGGGPAGSEAIERVFQRYFQRQGLATIQTPFDGRSDYGPFIDVGIPAGGLFTGAEDVKTMEEAELFGGTAGEAYDPCYHEACDTITNVNRKVLGQMTDAAAHAIFVFATDTSTLREGE